MKMCWPSQRSVISGLVCVHDLLIGRRLLISSRQGRRKGVGGGGGGGGGGSAPPNLTIDRSMMHCRSLGTRPYMGLVASHARGCNYPYRRLLINVINCFHCMFAILI